jgi:sugar transferase EpsL
VKRIVDVVGAAVGLVVLSPVLGVIAVLVRWKLGSPVLFRQTRPGLHGQPFELIKFRTMTDARGPDGELLPDVDRLPPVGRWLRATSLDELPELVNVLRGDMSLVGPRPLLMEYLGLYTTEQARRHEVRPGLTGWSQVNGRNAPSWADKLAMDVWYVDHRSLWLDLRILARTVASVVARRGVTADGHATTPKFTGSD